MHKSSFVTWSALFQVIILNFESDHFLWDFHVAQVQGNNKLSSLSCY